AAEQEVARASAPAGRPAPAGPGGAWGRIWPGRRIGTRMWLAEAPPGKGETVSKPPAAAGGVLRDATGGTGNGVTIDGHPAALGRAPGLEMAGGREHMRADGDGAGPDDGGTGRPEGGWRSRLAGALEFARRQLDGDGEVDQFGFDPEFNSRVLMPIARILYQRWFGVQMRGLSHVPEAGPALVVANHSGTLPVDAVMLQSGLHDEHPA